ncbi:MULTISPECIES: acyltransferase [Methanobacterium]|uniref:Acyltransferase n=1 Tax=Methanobacterium veterum TaxID=408577 RepID=A0A9E5A8J2_9EURY|nr:MULTISPECIES: acyltransferase [Methanobacterium]MCZ3367509.1 acyltransferase [Methanobacterium veterum]MCZ3373343.1 acyltransferase [Methanobacterium veterum]
MEINTKGISPGVFMGSSKVSIGYETFVNYNCFFDAFFPIIIGNSCLIAMEVMFCTSTHNLDNNGKFKEATGMPINVGDNCWIGARTTILPGVTIGNGCIIAAGSLVNKDCDANCLYAGIPARKIKKLDKYAFNSIKSVS